MRSAEYSYPPDEFDAAANAGGPRGAHRAPRSAWSRWWPFVVALVVFPLLAFGAVTYLSGSGDLGSATDVAASSDGADAEVVEPAETDPATDESTDPAEVAEPEEPVAEEPEPDPVPPADLERTVKVMNATGTGGLAGGAREVLEAGGFAAVSTGNWSGADMGTSVVLYPEAADLGTATEVAAELGIARVEEDSARAEGIIMVILETDYEPGQP